MLIKPQYIIFYNILRIINQKNIQRIEVKIEWEVIECKKHAFLEQCLGYDGYFQKPYESVRGRKGGEQGKMKGDRKSKEQEKGEEEKKYKEKSQLQKKLEEEGRWGRVRTSERTLVREQE